MREINKECSEESIFKKVLTCAKRTVLLYVLASVLFTSYTINSHFAPKKQKIELTYEQIYNKTKIQSIAREWAKFYSIPEEIVLGVIQAESGYRIDATSQAGAMGLMQLMPQTYSWLAGNNIKLKGENPYDPNVNIKYGCMYLASLKREHKSWTACLSAYNSGKHDARYAETLAYVDRVLTIADYK